MFEMKASKVESKRVETVIEEVDENDRMCRWSIA